MLFPLNLLKFFLQLGWEHKIIDHKSYGALILILDEIGRMLGGWKKNLGDKTSKATHRWVALLKSQISCRSRGRHCHHSRHSRSCQGPSWSHHPSWRSRSAPCGCRRHTSRAMYDTLSISPKRAPAPFWILFRVWYSLAHRTDLFDFFMKGSPRP